MSIHPLPSGGAGPSPVTGEVETKKKSNAATTPVVTEAVSKALENLENLKEKHSELLKLQKEMSKNPNKFSSDLKILSSQIKNLGQEILYSEKLQQKAGQMGTVNPKDPEFQKALRARLTGKDAAEFDQAQADRKVRTDIRNLDGKIAVLEEKLKKAEGQLKESQQQTDKFLNPIGKNKGLNVQFTKQPSIDAAKKRVNDLTKELNTLKIERRDLIGEQK